MPQAQERQNFSDQACRECGAVLEIGRVQCPRCGVVNIGYVVRKERNRPNAEQADRVLSRNFNGFYTIDKMDDGSLVCNCNSFLHQNGVNDAFGFSTCVHIRDQVQQGRISVEDHQVERSRPSEWQRFQLQCFGVKEIPASLTNAQAYRMIGLHLRERQGIEYRELVQKVRTNPVVSVLPQHAWGVEMEGFIKFGTKHLFIQRLREKGIECQIQDYNHNTQNRWRVVPDSSVSINDSDWEALELVSPKLFGWMGYQTLIDVLSVWNEIGGKVNRNCGYHSHVDGYGMTEQMLFQLLLIGAKLEPIGLYLVSPSRRDNRFCKRLSQGFVTQFGQEGMSMFAYGGDRYYWLNLDAFKKYKSVENRLHQGTLEARKIWVWSVFTQKLMETVRKGMTHRDVDTGSIEKLLDSIGIGGNCTSRLQEVRAMLIERYNHFRNQQQTPITVIPVEQIEFSVRNRQTVLRYRNVNTQNNVPVFHLLGEIYGEGRSIFSLGQRSDRLLQIADVMAAEQGSEGVIRRWQFESVVTSYNSQSATIHCGCRSFRSSGYCPHSRSVARLIIAQMSDLELQILGERIYSEMLGLRRTRAQTLDDLPDGFEAMMCPVQQTVPGHRGLIYRFGSSVVYHHPDDWLTCSCSAFAQEGRCGHVESVAHYLVHGNPPSSQTAPDTVEIQPSRTGRREAVGVLRTRRPRHIITVPLVGMNQSGEYEWSFPSSTDSNSMHRTIYCPEDDTVSCSCRGFIHNGSCYHAINVARFVVYNRHNLPGRQDAESVQEAVCAG